MRVMEYPRPSASTRLRPSGVWGFRSRVLFSLIAVALITAGLVGGSAYFRFQDTLNREARGRLDSYTAVIIQALEVTPEQVSLDPSRLTNLFGLGDVRFRVVRGGQIYEIGRYPENPNGWLTTRRELGQGFVLEAALNTANTKEALRALLQTELLALPLSLALALGISYLLLGYLMRPIQKLTEATHALTQQRFPAPLPIPPGKDELSDLAHSFNRMTEAVRGFLERERSFTRYTSHELRTPLATLRAQFEALEQNLIPRETSLPTIKNSLTRLERILSGLLALTRSPQSDAYPVPLDSIFQAIFVGLRPEDRPRVSLEGDPQALVLGYEELLQQALGNLISNALKFSQGQVVVTTEVGERIQVAVQDHGPGVPQATLSKLGEPFFRLQPQAEGLGLGLALTRHIAAQLGGTLEFRNRPGGFIATLTLPKAEVAHVA